MDGLYTILAIFSMKIRHFLKSNETFFLFSNSVDQPYLGNMLINF